MDYLSVELLSLMTIIVYILTVCKMKLGNDDESDDIKMMMMMIVMIKRWWWWWWYICKLLTSIKWEYEEKALELTS